MTVMIDVEPIVVQLYKELEEVSQKNAELNKKVEDIKNRCNSLDGFVCNIRYITDTLCDAAQNDQRANSLYHFINLIEHEAYKGENDAGSL